MDVIYAGDETFLTLQDIQIELLFHVQHYKPLNNARNILKSCIIIPFLLSYNGLRADFLSCIATNDKNGSQRFAVPSFYYNDSALWLWRTRKSAREHLI